MDATEQTESYRRSISDSSNVENVLNRTRSLDSQLPMPAPTHSRFPYEHNIPRFFSSKSFPRHGKCSSRASKGKSTSQAFQDEFHATLERMHIRHSLRRSEAHSSDPNVQSTQDDPSFEPSPLYRPKTSPAGSWLFGSTYVAEQLKRKREGRSSTWAFENSSTVHEPAGPLNRSRSSSGRSQASSVAPLSFNAILYPSRNKWVISETAAEKLEKFAAARNGNAASSDENEGEEITPLPAVHLASANTARTDSASSSNGGSSSTTAAHIYPKIIEDASQSSNGLDLYTTLSRGSTVIDWKGHAARQVEYAEIDRKRNSVLGWIKRYLFCGLCGSKEFWEEGDNDASSVRRYRLPIPWEEEELEENTRHQEK